MFAFDLWTLCPSSLYHLTPYSYYVKYDIELDLQSNKTAIFGLQVNRV